MTKNQMRITELEEALGDALEWAEMVAGSDFEQSDTLQNCLYILTQGEEGRKPE